MRSIRRFSGSQVVRLLVLGSIEVCPEKVGDNKQLMTAVFAALSFCGGGKSRILWINPVASSVTCRRDFDEFLGVCGEFL